MIRTANVGKISMARRERHPGYEHMEVLASSLI
jgi:hypothetical protein